jgi:hypothetical protein
MVARQQRFSASHRLAQQRQDVLRKLFYSIILLAGLLMPLEVSDSAEVSRAGEYEIKAAFLYKFIKYTEWPPDEPKMTGDAFVIGVLGKDPFGAVLDRILEGELIDRKKIIARRFARIEDAADSHILFISSSTQDDLPRILKILEGYSVLSVSEIENFAQRGGIVALKKDSNRIVFEINVDAARRAKLTLSSQLLGLARIVRERS